MPSSLTSKTVRGRFAPTPSGPLHFGSLVAALASFLHAKHQDGQWLVRIDDIDTPRIQQGASDAILRTLESFHLNWDESVIYQSNNQPHYHEVFQTLLKNDLLYACECTRQMIKSQGNVYRKTCTNKKLNYSEHAIRFRNCTPILTINDAVQGAVHIAEEIAGEHFIVRRRDEIFAYQFAVVIDDLFSGVNQVVRGFDLIESTFKQLSLYQTLGQPLPSVAHLPLVADNNGEKLSKTKSSPSITSRDKRKTLLQALTFLGHKPDNHTQAFSTQELIDWAIEQWDINQVPHKHQIIYDELT